jgi:septation ring formation regulator EzrA
MKNLNKNSADYDSDVARLTKHLSDLNEKQGEFREELKLTNKEMNAAQENFSNLLGGLATGDMKAVQEGLMGIAVLSLRVRSLGFYCHTYWCFYRRYRISYSRMG